MSEKLEEKLRIGSDRFFASRWWTYGSLLVLHLIFCVLTFTRHFTDPLNVVLTNWGDGLKNNFTLLSYVKSPIGADGLFKFNAMNYPYGDYVYTTDNTPFFAIPFRWFCQNIYDLSDYTLAIYNFLIIANIILCGLLVYYVFNKLLKNPLLAWLFALLLPWTNFQLLRLHGGNYNLSLTALCLISMLLVLLWDKYSDKLKYRIGLLCLMVLFGYSCFLIHGYYIAIITSFIAGTMLFYGIYKLVLKQEGGWRAIWASILLLILTLGLVFLTLYYTDGYYHIRDSYAQAYDWREQKTNFSLLFTHYGFQQLYFPAWSTKVPAHIELMCYMGNIGLYSVGILFLISLFSQPFRLLLWEIQKNFFKSPLRTGIIVAGLVLLSISLGERYYPLQASNVVGLPLSIDSLYSGEGIFILFLLVCVIVTLFYFLKKKNKLHYTQNSSLSIKGKRWRAVLFYLLSAIALFLLFGDYDIGHLKNLSNPFFYAHKFTRLVEQFRSLVRFAWPFYWAFYLWIGYILAELFFRLSYSGKTLMVLLLVLLGGTEAMDYMRELHGDTNKVNILSSQSLERVDTMDIDWNKYQALMPVPYFAVGCESADYNFTIDDIPGVSHLSYQLSIYSGLPLMAGKLSRTPQKISKQLMECINADKIPLETRQLMNDKPILVFVYSRYLDRKDLSVIPQKERRPYAYKTYWNSQTLVERKNLIPVDTLGEVYFYAWPVN